MHKINPDQAEMFTDTVQSYGAFDAAEMLSVISREGVWRGQSCSIVVNTAFALSRCKINAECYFLFMFFCCYCCSYENKTPPQLAKTGIK